MDSMTDKVSLKTIAYEWTKLGITGFGGPSAHITLLRKLSVLERKWLSEQEFEDAIGATNLLPGPASTQMAIFIGWHLRRVSGAIVAGLCFISPGLILILILSELLLRSNLPLWVNGAALGAGAAVPMIALSASHKLLLPSWKRAGSNRIARIRWIIYVILGIFGTVFLGPYLVVLLIACGGSELILTHRSRPSSGPRTPLVSFIPVLFLGILGFGGISALAFVAFKIGALSFGGGFVIVPLMQHDAVVNYHWMSAPKFLDAVALGQITPGPVVQTVAVVGYSADGIRGGLLAALIAFTPSFLFIIFGGPHFSRLRNSQLTQSFLRGSAPAAIGAIGGAAITLGLALSFPWQIAIVVFTGVWLLAMKRGTLSAILISGAFGVGLSLIGVVSMSSIGH